MQAMILAAGRGERMRPLTDTIPKPLLKVNQKSLIECHLEKLAATGIKQVVINHAWLGEMIEAQLGDGSKFGIKIIYSPEPLTGLETAGGVINALDKLGKLPFLIISADIFTDIDFNNIKLPSDKLANLILVENPPHNFEGDFGLSANGELNLHDSQSFTFSGVGIFSPEFFAQQKVTKLPLRVLLQNFINQKKISGQIHYGFWSDVGTIDRLLYCNRVTQK